MTKTKTQNQKLTSSQKTLESVWKFENESQAALMTEDITPENCGEKLKLIRKVSRLKQKDLAKALGVSESTVARLEKVQTKPTDDFLLRLSGLVVIGHAKYSKLNDAERNDLSKYVGAAGGVGAGIAGSIGAISAGGAVAGLSAAGVTSGLAAIGGGAMLGGLAVVASIPVAAGIAGFGIAKGIKNICKANNLKCMEVDGRYELVPEKSQSDESMNE